MTLEALARSKVAIGVCMKDFVRKRGVDVVQDDGDDAEG